MECAICLADITISATGSCAHHFCYECLLEWCRNNSTCPKCRHNIREIRLDPEFDQLLRCDNHPGGATLKLKQPTVRLRLSPKHRAGITLSDPQSGPGVLVAYLKPAGRAHACGLRVADVILSINGLPASSHEVAISLIEEASSASRDVVCTLLSRGDLPADLAAAGAAGGGCGLRLRGGVTHRSDECEVHAPRVTMTCLPPYAPGLPPCGLQLHASNLPPYAASLQGLSVCARPATVRGQLAAVRAQPATPHVKGHALRADTARRRYGGARGRTTLFGMEVGCSSSSCIYQIPNTEHVAWR